MTRTIVKANRNYISRYDRNAQINGFSITKVYRRADGLMDYETEIYYTYAAAERELARAQAIAEAFNR